MWPYNKHLLVLLTLALPLKVPVTIYAGCQSTRIPSNPEAKLPGSAIRDDFDWLASGHIYGRLFWLGWLKWTTHPKSGQYRCSCMDLWLHKKKWVEHWLSSHTLGSVCNFDFFPPNCELTLTLSVGGFCQWFYYHTGTSKESGIQEHILRQAQHLACLAAIVVFISIRKCKQVVWLRVQLGFFNSLCYSK